MKNETLNVKKETKFYKITFLNELQRKLQIYET